MGLTPGVRVSNWVKLRPFNGRSFTMVCVTTVPNSDVEVRTCAAVACTVTVCMEDPTFRVKSKLVVWFTSSVNSACVTASNPSLLALRVYCPGRMFRIT